MGPESTTTTVNARTIVVTTSTVAKTTKRPATTLKLSTPSSTTSTTTQRTPSFTTPNPQTTLPTFKPRMILTPKENFSVLNALKCGTRTSVQFRITFGETADEGQFPWVVSLIYKNRRKIAIPLCGGAL